MCKGYYWNSFLVKDSGYTIGLSKTNCIPFLLQVSEQLYHVTTLTENSTQEGNMTMNSILNDIIID